MRLFRVVVVSNAGKNSNHKSVTLLKLKPIFFRCQSRLASSCYVLVDDELTAAGARSKCSEFGGHLAVVDDTAENDFISQLARGSLARQS